MGNVSAQGRQKDKKQPPHDNRGYSGSRRTLLFLLVVLVLGLIAVVGLAKWPKTEAVSMIEPVDSSLEINAQHEVLPVLIPSSLEGETLQNTFDKTSEELLKTKKKLLRANASAQEKVENPPLEQTRKSVANGLDEFRSAVSRFQNKLGKMNSSTKEEQ